MRLPAYLTFPILFLAFSIPSSLADERTAQQAVADGNRLLAEGSYVEAARAYGDAIELDPNSYLNYYKRATAYLSLGRHTAAVDDFDSILRLNPAFAQAHYQKAKVLAKEGEFVRAEEALQAFAKIKVDADATELSAAVRSAEIEKGAAHHAKESKNWSGCLEHATRALDVGPNSAGLRELRAGCATELGDIDSVYADLSRLAALNPSALTLSLRLTHISYFLLASSSATNHVKQCLYYDPDSKPCKKLHKLLRSLDKETVKARNFVEGGNYRQAIKVLDGNDGLLATFETALEEGSHPQDGLTFLPHQFHPRLKSQARLELYALACKAAVGANDMSRKGIKWCEETFEMDENNTDALVGRGEKLLKDENWEEAVRVFDRAFENTGRSSQDILNRVQKAQRLLKVSKQKDYYKVLGVPRDADERTIKKAFRTAAKIAHPDVGGSEAKMATLNEAYEVLSDSELRARYDNGDDPNDPQQGGPNPFAHHGGGMPFQFFQQGGGFPGGGFPGGGGGQKVRFQWGG